MRKTKVDDRKLADPAEGQGADATEEPVASTSERSAGDDAPAAESQPGIPELTEKITALEDSLLRAKADFQNLRRRSMIERAEATQFANAELMRALLPVLDDLERAQAAAESGDQPHPIVEGMRLVYEKFMKVLGEHGLEPIDALGQPFDPEVHEALMRQKAQHLPPGMVVQEAARGYRLRERVIRPAKVIVTQAVADSSADSAVSDASPPGGDRTDADL
jgi:molecular chaperone GrpE